MVTELNYSTISGYSVDRAYNHCSLQKSSNITAELHTLAKARIITTKFNKLLQSKCLLYHKLLMFLQSIARSTASNTLLASLCMGRYLLEHNSTPGRLNSTVIHVG